METKTKFTFVDLFAGIGGMRIPFEELGGRCVFASEFNKFSAITYEANFHQTPSGDITKIDPLEIPPHDLLLAGFPCQPFSHAGLKRGFDDIRGTLFFNIANIIKARRPAAVLLENVRGLLSHDHGNTFATIKQIIEQDLGYYLFTEIHNAKNYGLPQNRARIFMVALREKYVFEFPKAPNTKTRVGDVLEGNVDDKYTISDGLWNFLKERKALQRDKGNGFGYSLFYDDDAYTNTLSARYYKDGAEILIWQEGKNPRKITPREVARLQGFPDNFIIPVSDTQAYRQFGNSVAVPCVRSIAKNIALYLDSLHK